MYAIIDEIIAVQQYVHTAVGCKEKPQSWAFCNCRGGVVCSVLEDNTWRIIFGLLAPLFAAADPNN